MRNFGIGDVSTQRGHNQLSSADVANALHGIGFGHQACEKVAGPTQNKSVCWIYFKVCWITSHRLRNSLVRVSC